MSKQNGDVIGFQFQEIPLKEALTVILAGDGSYADVKQVLLEKLPLLPDNKAFAFGLPSGKEVPEDQRRGLCLAINATLKRAKFNWRITYSGVKKLFICVPRSAPRAVETNGHSPKHRGWQLSEELVGQIMALRKEGLTSPQIAEKLGIPKGSSDYVVYGNYHKRNKGRLQPKKTQTKDGLTPESLVSLARIVLKYDGPIIGHSEEVRMFRAVVITVGHKDLGFALNSMCLPLGMKRGAADWYSKNYKKDISAQVAILRKALGTPKPQDRSQEELHGKAHGTGRDARNQEILAMRKAGMEYDDIASKTGLHRVTVFKIVRRLKEGGN